MPFVIQPYTRAAFHLAQSNDIYVRANRKRRLKKLPLLLGDVQSCFMTMDSVYIGCIIVYISWTSTELFCVRLLSVLRRHSVVFIPNVLRLRSISIPDVILYIVLPILILEKDPILPFFNVDCQTGELLVAYL